MTRRYALVLSLFLGQLSYYTLGQSTFGRTYEYGSNTLIENVTEIGGGFLVAGWAVDSNYKSFISSLDATGDEISSQQIYALDTTWLMSGDNNSVLNDSTIIIAALTWALGIEQATVFWVSSGGDTLFSRAYTSPYIGNGDQTDWMRPTSIDVDPEENIYVSCQLFWPDETGNDFVIMKLNAQGDSLWSYLVNEEESEYCFDIQAVDDGVIVGTNSLTGPGPQRFFKLTVDGELEWIFNTDALGGSEYTQMPNEIILEPDGIVFSTEHSTDGTDYRLPAILKSNFEGSLLWHILLPGSEAGNAQQYCYHLVRSPDGGYLAAAWQFEEDPANPEVNGTFNWNAWLIKVSHEGVLEWQRFYHFIESTNDKHRVYDLKATSDGGYIFCGDAIDNDIETNGQVIQKGWLVKVDGCGCLVPGCDENCSTGVPDLESEHSYFIVGPNPANQFLNIYFFNDHPDAELRMYDMSGRLVQSFVPAQGNTTYMLSVDKYPVGVYTLALCWKGRILQSIKTVIE